MAILHGPCHHVISSLFLIIPPVYLRLLPLSLTEHVQCPACSLTFYSGLPQLSMSDNWFDTAEKIYFFSSFNRKNTYVLTKLAQSTRHLVSAPHSVSQHHKVRVTQASSTHLLLPSYRKRPSTLFLSPAALLYANFVFCHVKFPSFSSVSENDPPHHACARDSKLLLKHEILEHITFQMTRPSEQSILSRLANPAL